MKSERGVKQTPMPLPRQDPKSETTRPLTGADASFDEAQIGDAGNGGSAQDVEGLAAARETDDHGIVLEGDPGIPNDISVDQIERHAAAGEEDEEREVTARPSQPVRIEEPEV